MYAYPKSYKRIHDKLKTHLKKQLKAPKRGQASSYAHILLKVELGLTLLERLDLADEPITALWTILSSSDFIRSSQLQDFDDHQKMMIANTRVLLSNLAGRFACENALRDYIRHIPKKDRAFDFELDRLDTKLIGECRTSNRFQDRIDLFNNCLLDRLPFKTSVASYVEANKDYEFRAEIEGGTPRNIKITFSEADLAYIKDQPVWFSTDRPRQLFNADLHDLRTAASYIDQCEPSTGKTWVQRLDDIEYYAVREGKLQKTDVINIDGLLNLAGMVAAGKSTLAILLAAYLVHKWHCPEAYPHLVPDALPMRITLVVGDTASVIRLIDQFNRWFCHDPEVDNPVAVPILGQTTRAAHIKQMHESQEYQQAVAEGRIYWGERFLNLSCALQAKIQQSKAQQENGQSSILLMPGKEPCNQLREPLPEQDKVKTKKKRPNPARLCPFFPVCRTHQRYHDLPKAQIWVTTPGAMGQTRFPRHLGEMVEDKKIISRPIYAGDLIYEQSDIVVFDEADAVMNWFDRIYAQEIKLTAHGKGILDDIHRRMSAYWGEHRLLDAPTIRWTHAQNNSVVPLGHIVNQLDEYEVLREWLSRGYFTALTLFYKLARRMLGLKEYEDARIDKVRLANDRLIAPVLAVFEELTEGDPLERFPPDFKQGQTVTYKKLAQIWNKKERASGESKSKAWKEFDELKEQILFRLIRLMSSAMTTGDSTQSPAVLTGYKAWLKEFIPDLQERLDKLQAELRTSDEPRDQEYHVDSIEELSQRLQFAMTAILLDRHTRIVFYEWHNRPTEIIEGVQPHRRIPSSLTNILPLPPTGRMFGIYYWQTPSDEKRPNDVLSSFGYTNIGRDYILNFHRMRYWLDTQRGPNVLLMSGTSYLPKSCQFHIGVTPDSQTKAVIKPNSDSINITATLKKSKFVFLPQYISTFKGEEPIRVSGAPDKRQPLKALAEKLVGVYENGGYLGQEIRDLESLGQDSESGELWRDRARLLLFVNSYEQAKWVYETLQQRWTDKQKRIYYLVSANSPSDEDDLRYFDRRTRKPGQLVRIDIEEFAKTDGQILIAPMQAIGRGFNILNTEGKAAFGAVYFLTRPMPHPHDTPAIMQEINRRAYDWFADPNFRAWQADGIYERGVSLRREMMHYWTLIEQRSYYHRLWDEEDLHAYPRQDIAATTIGQIIQAIGRLMRGGVPFHAYFVDAAWAPQYSRSMRNINQKPEPETPETSLLAAMIGELWSYTEDPVGSALYAPILERLKKIENFDYDFKE